MTFQDVFQELIEILSSKGDGTISWEQVRQWPKNTIEIFQNAGWLKPKSPAKRVECPGCEENCYMPVHSITAKNDQPAKNYVACDQRDDMGRIPIPPDYLQQWQITENQVAQWVGRELSIRGKPKKDKGSGTIRIGYLQGTKRNNTLELSVNEQAFMMASGHSLPLIEVVYLVGNQLEIDQMALLNMVDRPPPSDRYNPSLARREARKLDTQTRYKGWQKAYRELKKTRRNMSDVWYSQQIEKMDIAEGRDSETIRKEMKK
jgi:hypothetical protein